MPTEQATRHWVLDMDRVWHWYRDGDYYGNEAALCGHPAITGTPIVSVEPYPAGGRACRCCVVRSSEFDA